MSETRIHLKTANFLLLFPHTYSRLVGNFINHDMMLEICLTSDMKLHLV
jgi:hypothetical protein